MIVDVSPETSLINFDKIGFVQRFTIESILGLNPACAEEYSHTEKEIIRTVETNKIRFIFVQIKFIKEQETEN
jgi:hypothetical protein